ncbi:MAG: hypothetical protein FJX23_04610 [Alphaproteobacteria bacterium]|nr:hypothetical protein [Alphaproteobacteria bacterium]
MAHVSFNISAKGVANVVLNRADVHNAFDETLIAELTQAFQTLGADEKVRVVVLSGEGKTFSAGADINWMKKMQTATKEENLEDARKLAALFKTINDCPKPVIGVVQGAAIGGGVGLVSCCDHVIAASGTNFAFSEVRLGLVPATIAPYVARKIGETHARSLFLSGDVFTAERAMHIGLVHEIVPATSLNVRMGEVIEAHLKCGPQAVKYAKKLIADLHRSDIIEYTAQLIAFVRSSPEGQEGMTAHMNKKLPNWAAPR